MALSTVRADGYSLQLHASKVSLVCLHDDAVVQGLPQLPFMRDMKRWTVMTVGTGLGNASHTNRAARHTALRR